MHASTTSRREVAPDNSTDLAAEMKLLRARLASLQLADGHDDTTGLPDRAAFLETLSGEFARARRYEHDLSLVLIHVHGLDHLQRSRGDAAVTQVLMSVAAMCEATVRNGVDRIGRMGDGELAVALPQTKLADAMTYASRIRDLIARSPVTLATGQVRMGMRLAVDGVQDEDASARDCLQRAAARLV